MSPTISILCSACQRRALRVVTMMSLVGECRMFWMNPWTLGDALWRHAVAIGETAAASDAVIRHRTFTIDSAMRDPLGADYAELGKMVPEKLAAFSQSGMAMFDDMMALQSDCFAQWRDLTAVAMSGRPPSGKAIGRIERRSARIATKISRAGGRALAPIHATATANQRRLGKG